ncbi:MAG: baseplate J/gp47 family protein [Acetobacter sp.]|uniref:baseplate J/gp47 family protein n=1 Tax=unclassified Acetobacter TaxID=2628570 RepID=UPI0025C685A8|nr:baseplate J/gp47 family protein [Acetobacter sp. UBA5411]
MNLSLQNFSTLVSNSCTAAQSACSSLMDFTTGSVSRSIFEANATVALWIQYLILQTLSVTRLGTSFGDDVDSWIAQFGITRLPAAAATTTETFICLTPDASSATVPVGAIVKSSDGSILFSVIKDQTNPSWSESSNGYIRQNGVASITCPVECTVAGSVGNVMSGALNTLGTQISGIDTCTNLSSVSNGYDEETDESVKSRINLWFSSLSSATLSSIEYAIESTSPNIFYQIIENKDPSGYYRAGFFYVVVDDGSGNISSDSINKITTAIESVRACGVEFSVIASTIIPVSVVVPITVKTGTDTTGIESTITTSISDYINSLTVGAVCSYTKISSVVFSASENIVESIGVITVNQQSIDVGGQTGTAVRLKDVEFSVSYT